MIRRASVPNRLLSPARRMIGALASLGVAALLSTGSLGGCHDRAACASDAGLATPSSRPASPAPPGACVVPPDVEVTVEERDGSRRWKMRTYRATGLDLDGRGTPIVLVPVAAPSPTPDNFAQTLFLMTGAGCGVRLGSVVGLGDPMAGPPLSHGLRSLETMSRAYPPPPPGRGNGLLLHRYRFDGVAYRPAGPTEPR